MAVSYYDSTARPADRALDNIEGAWTSGDYKEVKRLVSDLYNAAQSFKTDASYWEEAAETFENKLLEIGEF